MRPGGSSHRAVAVAAGGPSSLPVPPVSRAAAPLPGRNMWGRVCLCGCVGGEGGMGEHDGMPGPGTRQQCTRPLQWVPPTPAASHGTAGAWPVPGARLQGEVPQGGAPAAGQPWRLGATEVHSPGLGLGCGAHSQPLAWVPHPQLATSPSRMLGDGCWLGELGPVLGMLGVDGIPVFVVLPAARPGMRAATAPPISTLWLSLGAVLLPAPPPTACPTCPAGRGLRPPVLQGCRLPGPCLPSFLPLLPQLRQPHAGFPWLSSQHSSHRTSK